MNTSEGYIQSKMMFIQTVMPWYIKVSLRKQTCFIKIVEVLVQKETIFLLSKIHLGKKLASKTHNKVLKTCTLKIKYFINSYFKARKCLWLATSKKLHKVQFLKFCFAKFTFVLFSFLLFLFSNCKNNNQPNRTN